MRSELRKKYFLDWGNAFSKKDDEVGKPSVELVTVSRKRTAKAGEDVEFINPIVKRRSKSKSRSKKKGFRFSLDLVIGLIFFFMGVNLFFTSGGIIDLIQSKARIGEGEKYLSQVVNDNQKIKEEITKLQHSSSYQKKIAREHLGAIAKDEYLVIFGD